MPSFAEESEEMLQHFYAHFRILHETVVFHYFGRAQPLLLSDWHVGEGGRNFGGERLVLAA